MKRKISILMFILLIGSLHAQSKQLKKLGTFMAGNYSSEEQHKKDTTNYFHIKLQILPIWPRRKDGLWFYVEQAVAGSENKPYRQRVYHVTERKDKTFESAVYTFAFPLRFANKVQDFEEQLQPDSLKIREGCSVILEELQRDVFSGGTQGTVCASERQGATYAAAEVVVTKSKLQSWDRGFNEKGEQVWGATRGAYVFIKE